MPVQILRLLGSDAQARTKCEDRKYVLYDDVMDEDEKEGEVCAFCVSVCDKMSDDVMNKDERDKALLDKV